MKLAGTAGSALAALALTVAMPAVAIAASAPPAPTSALPTATASALPTATATATTPGPGQPIGRIRSQSSTVGALQVDFSAVGLGPGESIDPKSVQVFLDATPVGAQAHPIGASPPPEVVRTAVLVVDISGSMQGAALVSAKSAAAAFLSAVPTDVRVGLVTVSTTATLVSVPTTNRATLSAAIGALTAGGNTALFDATLLAEKAIGTTGSRTIVLLTDGHDDGSTATLDQAIAAAQDSGAVLDAVSFGTADAQVEPLRKLTAAAGGRILATDRAADLAPAFRRAAGDISTEVLVTAEVPRNLAGTSVTVTVIATAGGKTIRDSAFLPLAALPTASAAPPASAFGPLPVVVRGSALGSHRDLVIGLAAIFLGVLGLLAFFVFSDSIVDARETRVRRRLSFYTLAGRASRAEPQPTALGDSSMARSAVQLAGKLVVTRALDAQVGRRLDGAGVPLKPAEWIVIQAGSAVGVGLLFALLSGGSPVAAVLGLIIGIGAPIGYLVIKEGRRSSAFMEQLPDTLQLIAGSLSVGHSLPQAMDAVVREERQPMSVEFNRALVEARLGMQVEDALEGISTRMDSQDFAWIVMAIRIQREVGGNLAEVLNTVANTIRERERLRRQVRGLSAEGRLSAWILGALPPVFGTYLVLVRPQYIKPLFTDPIGIVLLVLMLVTMTVGVFWLSRIVKVEV